MRNEQEINNDNVTVTNESNKGDVSLLTGLRQFQSGENGFVVVKVLVYLNIDYLEDWQGFKKVRNQINDDFYFNLIKDKIKDTVDNRVRMNGFDSVSEDIKESLASAMAQVDIDTNKPEMHLVKQIVSLWKNEYLKFLQRKLWQVSV
ncbi:hypothetical protein ABC382_00565 [Lysinibacillus sp. 1P01SD]|uniref:hypothetical protein n=1 Tax=Lysinibacillus sp. 1P01SD TaxID=3132285 RepID=UPI0039A04EB2